MFVFYQLFSKERISSEKYLLLSVLISKKKLNDLKYHRIYLIQLFISLSSLHSSIGLFNLIFYKSQICTSSTKIALFELFTKGLIWPTHALMVKLADLKL